MRPSLSVRGCLAQRQPLAMRCEQSHVPAPRRRDLSGPLVRRAVFGPRRNDFNSIDTILETQTWPSCSPAHGVIVDTISKQIRRSTHIAE